MTVAAPADSARPRPLRSLLSAVVVFLVLLLATFGLRGWQELSEVRAHERALAAEVAASERRIEALRERIERLQRDPLALDRAARQELGLVANDDVVLVLPAAPSGAPQPTSNPAP